MSGPKCHGGKTKPVLPFRMIVRRQEGFSLAELAITVIILGIVLTVVIVNIFVGTKQADLRGAIEQVKEAIRTTYALADSAEATAGVRACYRIYFNNNGQGPPANAFKIEKSTDNGANWTVVPPSRTSAYRILLNDWMQPAAQGDCQLTYSSQSIVFKPRGSIVEQVPAGDNTVTLTSVSLGASKTVVVGAFGAIE
jgi:prepilin-type N-terminal cleavage/methylation domain-containing protein